MKCFIEMLLSLLPKCKYRRFSEFSYAQRMFQQDSCKVITNLEPKGESYSMPSVWKIFRGVDSEYKYSFPSRSPYANGKSADKVHLTSNQGDVLIMADGG